VVQSGGEAWKSTFTQVAPLAQWPYIIIKRKEANQWLQQTVGVFQTSDPLYIHLTSVPLTQTNLSTHGCKTETQSLYSHALTSRFTLHATYLHSITVVEGP